MVKVIITTSIVQSASCSVMSRVDFEVFAPRGQHTAPSRLLHTSFCSHRCTGGYLGPQHTHTHPFNGPFPGLPRWASTRKVKPIWILLKQETVSSSGISRAICRSAPRFRQITMPAPHHSVFTGRMPFPSPNQQRQSTEGTNPKTGETLALYICLAPIFTKFSVFVETS